jgi:hypothetical protein
MMLGVVVSLAPAGTMNTMLQPVARLDAGTFDPLPFVLNLDGRVASGQPGIYVMQVTFEAIAGPGEKGWAGTSWNTAISGDPGLTKVPDSYDPNIRTFDSNGIAPGGVVPIYQVNTDAGAPGDLDNIAVAIASPTISNLNAAERRNYLGTPNAPAGAGVDPAPAPGFPSWIGNFLLNWDGTGVSDVHLADQLVAFTSDAGTPTTYTDDFFLPSQPGQGAGFGFGDLTQPVVFQVDDLVQCCGQLPGALVTGGPLPTNDDDDPDQVEWSLVSLIGPDGPEAGASVDANGVFSWQSAATDSKGTYVATIQGINSLGMTTPVGTDTGTYTFRLVPEPATMSLLGLAMFGMLGFIRRR